MRILIVDDEMPARDKIRQFLQRMDLSADIEDVHDSTLALQLLSQNQYDLVYLDIEMPSLSGIELLEKIEFTSRPAIIFSTAYDQFAIKAFELHAIDYLLKPYDFDRFKKATEHALRSMQDDQSRMLELFSHWKQQNTDPAYSIWVSHQGKFVPLLVENIEWIEANGNYITIYVGQQKYMLKTSLTDILEKLDARYFIRVHRSYIVNQRCIKELTPKSHGDLFAMMNNGQRIVVSRNYRDQLL